MTLSDQDRLLILLLEAWKSLDDDQRMLVMNVIEGLRRTPSLLLNPTSDLTSNQAFQRRFTNRLKMYHGSHADPMSKKAFEYAFLDACSAAGWQAVLGSSATHPGADIVVNGVGISLKTEAARDIKIDRIHISKLRESAATKGYSTSEEFLWFIHRVLVPHLHEYERILMLRAFSPKRIAEIVGARRTSIEDAYPDPVMSAARVGNEVVYYLIEIPVQLLRNMGSILADDIILRGSAGSANATVPTTDPLLSYRVFFDGSDNKIQIINLPVSECIVHGIWAVPVETS